MSTHRTCPTPVRRGATVTGRLIVLTVAVVLLGRFSVATQAEPKPATLLQPAAPVAPEAGADKGGCGSNPAADAAWLERVRAAAQASNSPTPDGSTQASAPKWSCKTTTVKAEPVWKGQPLTFTFDVGNEGNADLHIKVKGG